MKRSTNGCTGNKSELRTAQVSAVPRTKLKVSGGTQTCTSDLQQQQPQPHHFKSYSLTGSSASQLSQSVRDRLLLGSQSLPKPGSSEHAALFHSHRGQQRVHRPTDGSLSDTTYSNYADLQNYYANSSPYSSWLRYSATYTSSLPARASAGMQSWVLPACVDFWSDVIYQIALFPNILRRYSFIFFLKCGRLMYIHTSLYTLKKHTEYKYFWEISCKCVVSQKLSVHTVVYFPTQTLDFHYCWHHPCI